MGSGVSGLYSGTYGAISANEAGGNAGRDKGLISPSSERKSQPYAESYGVIKEMVEYDKERGVYTDSGYGVNPTAVKVSSSVHNGVLVNKDDTPMNGHYTYVVTTGGELIIGKRNGNGRDGLATPHPTLIGGKNPKVKVAGIVVVSEGEIVKYDNESGHYKPNILSMPAADEVFSKLPNSAFHSNFKKNMGRS